MTGRTIYLGSAFGGVWKSTDKGLSWSPLTDSQPSLAVTALVVDHQRIFAATGDFLQSDWSSGTAKGSYFGAGILFSPDGGASWRVIGATEFTGSVIVDMDISPDGTTLYVAGSGFWTGTQDATGTWNFTQRSAGGWSSVRANSGNTDIVNLGKFTAGDSGPYIYHPSSGAAPSRATVNGTPQMPIQPSNTGRTSIAVDPKFPSYVYASMECVPVSQCPQFGQGRAGWWGVYYSTDYGATFNPFVSPYSLPGARLSEFGQPSWDLSIAVDPVDDYYVYFGLVNLWSYSYHTTPPTVSKISSPGQDPDCNQWPDRYTQLPPGIHCDQNSITFDAAGTLYSGNDGGVFASPFSTAAGGPRNQWVNLNGNLDITQFYQGASYQPSNPNRLLAGTQDNGTQTWNGASWQVTDAGDGGFTLIDPTDPSNTWFDTYPQLCVSRTQNGSTPAVSGPTWTRIPNGFTLNPDGVDPSCAVLGALFMSPIAMDPNNHANVLAGADRPYLTTNANTLNPLNVRWQDIKGTTFVPGSRSISATTICPDATNGGLFYLGTNDGFAVKTTNGYSSPPTWLLDSANLPGQWVTRIVCGRDTVYLTVGGSETAQGTHVFKQARAETSWTSIQGDLPNTTVTSLIEDSRTRTSTLYVSTDLGVYRSTNGGSNWLRVGHNLPNVPVVDLVFDPGRNLMYAFTHGRGVWRLSTELPENVPASVASASANPSRSLPPPVPRQSVAPASPDSQSQAITRPMEEVGAPAPAASAAPADAMAQVWRASQGLMRGVADFLFDQIR